MHLFTGLKAWICFNTAVLTLMHGDAKSLREKKGKNVSKLFKKNIQKHIQTNLSHSPHSSAEGMIRKRSRNRTRRNRDCSQGVKESSEENGGQEESLHGDSDVCAVLLLGCTDTELTSDLTVNPIYKNVITCHHMSCGVSQIDLLRSLTLGDSGCDYGVC